MDSRQQLELVPIDINVYEELSDEYLGLNVLAGVAVAAEPVAVERVAVERVAVERVAVERSSSCPASQMADLSEDSAAEESHPLAAVVGESQPLVAVAEESQSLAAGAEVSQDDDDDLLQSDSEDGLLQPDPAGVPQVCRGLCIPGQFHPNHANSCPAALADDLDDDSVWSYSPTPPEYRSPTPPDYRSPSPSPATGLSSGPVLSHEELRASFFSSSENESADEADESVPDTCPILVTMYADQEGTGVVAGLNESVVDVVAVSDVNDELITVPDEDELITVPDEDELITIPDEDELIIVPDEDDEPVLVEGDEIVPGEEPVLGEGDEPVPAEEPVLGEGDEPIPDEEGIGSSSRSSSASSTGDSSDSGWDPDEEPWFPENMEWYGRMGVYKLSKDVPLNDGSWAEFGAGWHPHEKADILRYDSAGNALYYQNRKRKPEEEFNGGDWHLSFRLAIEEEFMLFFSSCSEPHGCGSLRFPVAHCYQTVAFMCSKPEIVYAFVNRQWGKRIVLHPGMNFINFCSGELRFSQLGAFDVPRFNNLESEGVSFAAHEGTRWVLTKSPYERLKGEINPDGPHNYAYLFAPGQPPPYFFMVCPDDGKPTGTLMARAHGGEAELYNTMEFVMELKRDIDQSANRCSFFRLFLKPAKRANGADPSGFLMT